MKKKLKYIIPFLIIPLITPLYNILDNAILINIFGCGCVPFAETNMLNIAFNANDLRRLVYALLTILVFIISLFLSKSIEKKSNRIYYCAAVLITAAIVSAFICINLVWR